MRTSRPAGPSDPILAAALCWELDEPGARQLSDHGPEVTTLALLALARRIAELQSQARTVDGAAATLATPSGMIPVDAKPPASKRRKRPGAQNGHPGTRRAQPTKIDRHVEHRLPCCPDCGGGLQRCHRTRTRIIEDIPEEITRVDTEHTMHRDYYPHGKKDVEPVVSEAMPGASLGHHVVGLTSWFHFGLGITISQVVEILSYHLQTRPTSGRLIEAWRRPAVVLTDWYEQIAGDARDSAVPHADETGCVPTCWFVIEKCN